MHGLGNDFIVLDHRDASREIAVDLIREMSDRHRGIGCDQFIILDPVREPQTQAHLRIYNQDGSMAEACGNATRCVVSYLSQQLNVRDIHLSSDGGLLWGQRISSENVLIRMPEPKFLATEIPCSAPQAQYVSFDRFPELGTGFCVNVGNPHIVFFVDDVETFSVEKYGPEIENASCFPNKINVEFAQILDKGQIRMRVWERGAGVTQACGTGACATAIAAMQRYKLQDRLKILLDGGALEIHWRLGQKIEMTGPANFVFSGVWAESFSPNLTGRK